MRLRLRRSTIAGMVVAGLLALALVGPVAFAVVSLRCCPGSSGASAGAWVVVGLVVVAVVALAAACGGALVALTRRAYKFLRRGPS